MTDVQTARIPHQQRPALALAATAPAAASSSAPSKRKQRAPRSLLLLLKSLVGLRVRVDLKTDATVEGVVAEVVHDMDFTMVDACETKANGAMLRMDEVFVMGKTILYVHIPDRINVTQHLQQYTRMVRQSATMYTRTKRSSSSTAPPS